ncbi:MAG: hypothetical protein KIT33_08325 [Candidatus Kapabacteria bacterium]|nr:hypothetical protein [Ignavibacteriota bacterium]MCW5884960.1 hypothetical protein [Candidatus Kapabacteria bacterium]
MKTKLQYLIWLIILSLLNFTEVSAEYNRFVNSNIGTEFWLTVPPALIESGNTEGNFVKIFVNSDAETNVRVEVPGKNYARTAKVLPGISYEFNIEPKTAQPYIKTGLDPVFPSEIYKGAGIYIKSEYPVSVNVVVRYNSTGEGFLALPVNVLGNDYIVSSYGDASVYYPVYNSFPSLSGIVAAYDGTEVNFTLGGNSSTETSSGQKPGETIKKILNKGDVWMISSKGRDADLSGSKVSSSKPVAVISGSYSANIPLINKYSGYLAEAEIPTYTWGKTYYIPNVYGRKYSPVVRIYAKEPMTDVMIDGIFYGTISKSGGIIGEGYFEVRMNEITGNNFGRISSDKPINVVLYNSGVEEDGLPEPPGAPFQMNITPVEHFQKEMHFSIPAQLPSPTFANNYLNIIYKTDSDGSIPEDFLIGKYSLGKLNYKTLRSEARLESFRFTGTEYALLVIKPEATGSYVLKSSSSFTAYFYGYNSSSAYGSTAGLKLDLLNSEDKDPPHISWDINCDGIINGITEDMPEDAEIRSNLAGSVFLSDESMNVVRGNFEQILPGITGKAEWSIRIVDLNKDAKASVLFWDFAGNFSKADIFYKAQNTELRKKYENYGSFKIGDDKLSREFRIINNSDSIFTLSKLELQSGSNGFRISDNSDLPLKIQKDESYTFHVEFSPSEIGTFIDSIGFGDNCRFFFAGMVEATVGSPVIEVTDVYFGDLTIGGIDTAYSIISNTGVTELILKDYLPPTNSDFSIVFEREFSTDSPVTLQPGENFTMAVIFEPSRLGDYADSVVILSDAISRDNICLIKARSIEPGLVAGSYDWGRKRIFRNEFPSGPYQIENQTSSITLQNTGNAEILISGIEISDAVSPEAFEFNRQVFTNLRIPAGEKFDFKVNFRPVKIGQHYLKIRYINNFGSITISELSGFGTVPRINSQIITFDTTIVDNYDAPSIRRIEIKNLSQEEWQYADTANIYDFFTNNEEQISEKWAYFGNSGFKIDKQVANFPIQLLPGRSYILVAGFVPGIEGEHKATMQIISDGIDTANIQLIGNGMLQALTFSGGIGEACVGFETIISGEVKNNSKRDIEIAEVLIDEYSAEFTLSDKSLKNGFFLKAGESKNIELNYKPISIANDEIEVIVVESRSPTLRKSAKYYGNPVRYTTDLISSPAMQSASIGETISNEVRFTTNQNLEGLKLNELSVSVLFDEHILKPDLASLTLSPEIAGSFSIHKIDLTEIGKLNFRIKSISNDEITLDSDLFRLDFLLYYPNDYSELTDIQYIIEPIDNECVVVNNTISRVIINPVCGNDLRVINLGSDKYFLGNVSPNPVYGNVAEINFGIGISAHTELIIYNSIGIIVTEAINHFLEKGEYSAMIDTRILNSGAYYYIIKSGPFVDKGKLLISK